MNGILQWFKDTDRYLVLRGAAALTVIAYHTQDAYRTIFRPIHLLGHDISWLFLANGGMAVRVFFTLSGFLMFKAFYTKRYELDQQGIKRFFISRAKRIAPLYYFLLLVFVAVVYPGLLALHNLPTLLSLLTFTYSGAQPPGFANAFWALSTEVEFYVLAPLLVWLAFRFIKQRWQAAIFLAAIIAFGLASRWALGHGPVTTYGNLLTNLDAFLIGGFVCIWLYGFGKAITRNFNPAVCLGIGLLIFPVISAYQFALSYYGYFLAGPTVAAILTGLFIWASEKIEQPEYVKTTYRLRNALRRPAMWPAYLGVLSYGVYLWHQPIAGQVQFVGIIAKTGWKAFAMEYALIVIIAIICAAATNRYIERAH